jgi:hypothetical protein
VYPFDVPLQILIERNTKEVIDGYECYSLSPASKIQILTELRESLSIDRDAFAGPSITEDEPARDVR